MIDLYFSGELETQIMKYCKKLEAISEEYDVLIFMARKAICFYDALILNNMVKKPNHDVVITTSSRILSYDCEFLKGKKIALLDDIVLKGTTLNETIKFLLEKEINNFDIYYIASQSLENEKLKQIKSFLKEPILELESSEILILSNSITNYINASACSYNVDYPVFYLNSGEDFYVNYILKNN
ncbi:MAG: phosphoribosyltransferase [Acetatifactor sp.]|nr:phosphoribosyltransferase [Acetatifactor sp.]